ncbi:MAG TPA: precorrin-8X methylmutase [Thermodesulfobacteriaceae bacterium]|nr:precorrin-8X methylmutase [Thermodesulfobacteriaceae bacterium]
MSVNIRKIAPEEIEAESFRIIEEELGPHNFDPFTFKVVQRVIHATGDFSFVENMRFHSQAVPLAIEAVRSGKNVLTDVNMVAAGVSSGLLSRFGGEVRCLVADQEVARVAEDSGRTRSAVAIELGLRNNTGIVAIGNAPTALLAAMDCLAGMSPEDRPVIIGVPVGFVNAAESKVLLEEAGYPFITSLGRKGGSPVAAAVVNAVVRLAAV